MAADFLNPLNPNELRVLGSLIEKEITTPEYYPLTLNALVNACNQSSNREPVMSLDEQTVNRALDSLRDKRLAALFKGADSRVPKYSHRFGEADSDLGRPEIAVMCVLILRGPQTIGELRGRTGRMYEFAALDEVQAVLDRLSIRPAQALVTKLPRQSGFKESRYAHLLAGEPLIETIADEKPGSDVFAVPIETEHDRVAKLEAEVAALRTEMDELKRLFDGFRKQFE